MTDSYTANDGEGDWTRFMERMNEEFMHSFERNMDAQAEFVESWSRAVESSMDESDFADGATGYARAYEAWMDAAERMTERVNDAMAGEEVAAEEFRDIWLETANRAFKEVMSTNAFAAMTGQTVDDLLEAQRQADEAAETTLRTLGFATESDVAEVGDRLVELERRQHEIERKLDRVLEAVER